MDKPTTFRRKRTLRTFFDFTHCHVTPTQLTQLCQSRDWLDEGRNILLFGPGGLGNPHLAAAIGYGPVEQGVKGELPH